MTQLIRIDHYSTPPSPGEVLRRKLLDELNLTQAELARAIGISKPRLSMMLKGRCVLSADIALRLERVFGTPPQFWLRVREEFELSQERERLAGLLAGLTPQPRRACSPWQVAA